jgi:hypothetical protein
MHIFRQLSTIQCVAKRGGPNRVRILPYFHSDIIASILIKKSSKYSLFALFYPLFWLFFDFFALTSAEFKIEKEDVFVGRW